MTSTLTPPAVSAPSSPPAARLRRPGWRDPRLAVGVALVAGSVVAGSYLLSSADRTVTVLGARTDLAAGQPLGAEDLVPMEVRFATGADADRYLAEATALPEGATLSRPVGAGELLPRAALAADATGDLAELPLALEAPRVPQGVRPGVLVDVWAAADGEGGPGRGAQRLLTGVPVLSATRGAGAGSVRQVVVGVDADAEDDLARVLERWDPASLVLVLRPAR